MTIFSFLIMTNYVVIWFKRMLKVTKSHLMNVCCSLSPYRCEMENNNISNVDHQPSSSPSISIGSDKENTPDVEAGIEGEGEEIVVEYNHNDYVDLVGPMWYPLAKSVPSVSASNVLKKPGALPPFALYLQEERPKVQAEHPDLSFGEVGRMLGEMWQSLQVNSSLSFGHCNSPLYFSWRTKRCILREQNRSQMRG